MLIYALTEPYASHLSKEQWGSTAVSLEVDREGKRMDLRDNTRKLSTTKIAFTTAQEPFGYHKFTDCTSSVPNSME